MSLSYKLYECDLHCHTTRSDGNDSPLELIEKAASIGLKALAIVDHDITPVKNWPELKQLAKEKGLELVFGYEFSCDTDVDDVHIIGYELDWAHPGVLTEVKRAKDSKTEAYRRLCLLLKEKGYEIDFEKDILKFRDNRGNICRREPDQVQKKHIFEVLALKGHFPSWEEAKLFVRDNSDLSIRRRKVSPLAAIDIIRQAGGISVLAHPYLIDEEVSSRVIKSANRQGYIMELIGGGLDGIEACYTYDKTTYKGTMTRRQIEDEVKDLYGDKVEYITGGSDYHNDAKKGAPNPRFLGEAGISFEEFKMIFK